MPDTPAQAEQVPGSIDAANWYGMAAPPGTPAPVLQQLHEHIAAALGREEVRAAIRRVGFDPALLAPAPFADFVRAETAAWAPIIQAANIQPE